MYFLLQYFNVFVLFTLLAVLLQYFLRHSRFYKLAFKFPRGHKYLPNFISGAIVLHQKNNLFKIAKCLENGDKEYFCCWLPTLFITVKQTKQLEILFSSKHVSDKARLLKGIEELVGPTGLLTSGGEAFRESKRVFLKCFNSSCQDIIFKSLCRGSQVLLQELNKASSGGDWFKMIHAAMRTTTHNIMDGALDTLLPDDSPIYKMLEEDFESWAMVCLIKPTVENIPFAGKIHIFDRYIANARSTIYENWNDILTERRKYLAEKLSKNEEIPNQFIYNLIQERGESSVDEIFADITTLTFGALGTTSVGLSACLVLLGMHPEIQQKVFNEDKKIQKNLHGQEMTERDLQKYEFLNRVIKETLRLYPPIPIFSRHVSQEIQMGSCKLPKGCSLNVAIPIFHRDPNNFFNPTCFNPDRFLPENVENLKRHSYIPFSYGVRQCPGMRYGTQSLIYLVSFVVRNFQIISKYKTVEEMDENVSASITLVDAQGFPIRLVKRDANQNLL